MIGYYYSSVKYAQHAVCEFLLYCSYHHNTCKVLKVLPDYGLLIVGTSRFSKHIVSLILLDLSPVI